MHHRRFAGGRRRAFPRPLEERRNPQRRFAFLLRETRSCTRASAASVAGPMSSSSSSLPAAPRKQTPRALQCDALSVAFAAQLESPAALAAAWLPVGRSPADSQCFNTRVEKMKKREREGGGNVTCSMAEAVFGGCSAISHVNRLRELRLVLTEPDRFASQDVLVHVRRFCFDPSLSLYVVK